MAPSPSSWPPTTRCAWSRRITNNAFWCALALVILAVMPSFAANWPGWRGTDGGISAETGLPTSWGTASPVVWRTPIPGTGHSSPVVWGDAVFLTTADPGGARRSVICLDAKSGAVRWSTPFTVRHAAPTNDKNGYASATPVTDGRYVYAFFDDPGLVALDMAGKVIWTRPLGPFTNAWGMAASPALCDDLVIQCCDADNNSFIAGIDKSSGEVRWKTPRPDGCCYASPMITTVNGKPQVIVNGNTIIAYDPTNGTELWRCAGMRDTVVSPSIVAANGIVYATAGRNGLTVMVRATGRGDVTNTHVLARVASGGPYVPSPVLARDLLLLPGDDGTVRAVDARGRVVCTQDVPGHFTASPVAADGKLYWPNERGEVVVFDLSGLTQSPPVLPIIATNPMGASCLASPAVANGALFIRTTKELVCLAGAGPKVMSSPPVSRRGFAELKRQYDGAPGDDDVHAAQRVEAVQGMAAHADAATIAFLAKVARAESHWDVSAAALRALGRIGAPAVPALIEFAQADPPGGQDYLALIPIDALGTLQAAEAVPALLRRLREGKPLYRAAAARALAAIARAHPGQAEPVIPALLDAVKQDDAVTRAAAIDALAEMRATLGPRYDDVQQALRAVMTSGKDGAYHARMALIDLGRPSADPPRWLRAGPIRVKYQDGELRYLTVGTQQIARRIYFAVRDKDWGTAIPRIETCEVRQTDDSFRITLRAVCQSRQIDYAWTGEITGTPQGAITYRVTGTPHRDFPTARIGICVLYGAAELATQRFTVFGAGGEKSAQFSDQVQEIDLGRFTRLAYTNAAGLRYSAVLTGGTCQLEDQRGYGDSSYKVYSSLDGVEYGTTVRAGEEKTTALTIEVQNAKPVGMPSSTVVEIGHPLEGMTVPKVSATTTAQTVGSFGEVLAARGTKWNYNPRVHLPDDDMLFENLAALADQARTVRGYAAQGTLCVESLGIDPLNPPGDTDPRVETPLMAAWTIGAAKYLAEGGVHEARWNIGKTFGPAALAWVSAYQGAPVLSSTVTAPSPAPVIALAVRGPGGPAVLLANTTDIAQTVTVRGLGAADAMWMSRFSARPNGTPETESSTVNLTEGSVTMELAPYDAVRLDATPPLAATAAPAVPSTEPARRRPFPLRIVLGCLILLLLGLTVARAAGKRPGWFSFRANPQNTGIAGTTFTPRRVAWIHEAGSAIESTAAIAGNSVYVGTMGGKLLAINLSDGRLRWSANTVDPVSASPCVIGDTVYVGDEGGVMHAINATSGQEMWSYRTGGKIISSVTPLPGAVLFGSYDNKLYCLAAGTGQVRWAFTADNYVHGSPCVAGKYAVIAGCDGHVRLIELATGRQRAAVNAGGNFAASPAFDGGRVYVGSMNGEYLAINAVTGAVRWRFTESEPGGACYAGAAVAGNRVIFASHSNKLFCLDAQTRQVTWVFRTRQQVDSSPVIAGTTIFVGSGEGIVYGISLHGGQEVWRFETGGEIKASPSIAPGRMVIGNADGTLYCFAE